MSVPGTSAFRMRSAAAASPPKPPPMMCAFIASSCLRRLGLHTQYSLTEANAGWSERRVGRGGLRNDVLASDGHVRRQAAEAEVRRHGRHHRQRPGPAARQRADRQPARQAAAQATLAQDESLIPPHSNGEVPSSYEGGGVRSRSGVVASDPSVADYRATSPFEWGGIRRP